MVWCFKSSWQISSLKRVYVTSIWWSNVTSHRSPGKTGSVLVFRLENRKSDTIHSHIAGRAHFAIQEMRVTTNQIWNARNIRISLLPVAIHCSYLFVYCCSHFDVRLHAQNWYRNNQQLMALCWGCSVLVTNCWNVPYWCWLLTELIFQNRFIASWTEWPRVLCAMCYMCVINCRTWM